MAPNNPFDQSVGQTVRWVHLGSLSDSDQTVLTSPSAACGEEGRSGARSCWASFVSPPGGLTSPADWLGRVDMVTQAPRSARLVPVCKHFSSIYLCQACS